jgi:hypothetical protein
MIKHAVFALACIVTIWTVAAPAYGAQQGSETSSVTQADPSQEACIARREREGLNTRFVARRCVNPYN